MKVHALVVQQNELGVRRRQKHLPTKTAQELKEPAVSSTIELTGHVVEEQDRRSIHAFTEHIEFRHLEREDDGAVLALRGVVFGGDAPHFEGKIIPMRIASWVGSTRG